MSADRELIREEIAHHLSQVAAFAAAGSAQAQVGNDQALAFEMRCAAVALMSASALVEHLRPGQQSTGRRAA